ncbi:MAG: tetratricopeptide repeat protein [Bryobacteraceae bacterium]
MPRISALTLLLLTGVAVHSYALKPHWLRISAPHFEMYTTGGEQQALAELRMFEQVRHFFLETAGAKSVGSNPVRIIAFHSRQEYQPYSPNASAFAYYEQARSGDYIVLEDIAPEHRAAALHEYTHLVLTHEGLKLPVWLSEGLADLYSTLSFDGGRVTVGAPLPGRMYALRTEPWLPLDTLFAAGQSSPEYNDRQLASIFYAESWALVHMLRFGDGYAPHFGAFLAAIASGAAVPSALETAFGKTPAQLYLDLQACVRKAGMNEAVYRVGLPTASVDAQSAEPSALEVKLLLARMLASNPWKQAEGEQRLETLAAEYPSNPEIEESLGYLAWQERNPAQARVHFAAAVARGSRDAQMIAYLAAMDQAAGVSASQVLALLQKALAFNPNDYETRLHVALMAVRQKRFQLADTAFAGLKQVKPADTYPVMMALAYMQFERNDLAGAKSYAEQAAQDANQPSQRVAAQKVAACASALQPQPTVAENIQVDSTTVSMQP